MKAVLPAPAADGSPRLGEVPAPVAGPEEVLLAVRATALNRVDLLQLRGHYPPPAGESAIPGLEAAGEVVTVSAGVTRWRPGDRAAALLAGGGHAELVAAPAAQLLPIPAGWSYEEAAALPEAALTAWTGLVVEGRLRAGEWVLVAGATGGVGNFAVQLAHALGARVLAAGRDAERLAELRPVGAADLLVLGDDLAERARAATGGRGVDLVLDLVGGAGLPHLLAALGQRGRLVLVGLMAGSSATLDLGRLLRQRLTVVGSTLRSRSRAEKGQLVAGFLAAAAGLLAERRLLPRVARTFELAEIAAAYAHLERERPAGKVVVRVGAG